MTSPPLHTLGMHANHMSRSCGNERMQAILQWVGVGSVIMMGAAAAIHVYRDLTKPSHEQTYQKRRYDEMPDEVKRCTEGQCRSR
jgi:hypothetical protein